MHQILMMIALVISCTLADTENNTLSVYAASNNMNNITFHQSDLHGSYYSIRHLVIDEKHKFIFCPVEKVASTMFRQLFFRLSGDPYWFELPYYKAHRAAKQIGIDRMTEMFNDSTFTKAIFFRDPALRMLSAYAHLFTNRHSLPRYTKRITDLGENNTFETFVRLTLGGKIKNIHWNPQHRFCGFDRFHHKYNFIGAYERLHDHGRQLFDRVSPSLWDEFGAQGWSMTTVPKEPLKYRDGKAIRNVEYYMQNIPSNYNQGDCMFCDNYAIHKFNCSAEKCTKQRQKHEILTPDLWKMIRESDLFRRDYELFRQVTSVVDGPLDPDLYDKYPF